MGQGSGSKTDTAVKLVLIFFISLLSFSVGTFVGKQVSDADHRRASLEIDDSVDRGVASTHGAEAEVASISDEEVASLTREFLEAERATASEDEEANSHGEEMDAETEDVAAADPHAGYDHMAGDAKKEKATPAKAVTKAKPEAVKAKKVSVSDEVKKAADRVAETLAPKKDAPKGRAPTSNLPVAVAASSVGKYTVQVGSYASEDEARGYATKMKEKGYSAFYIPADVNGRTWYRVSVGLYGDAKGAEEYRQSLLKENIVKDAIVQKIVK